MREEHLYINGQFVESASKKTFNSLNPFNQEIVARVAHAGVEDARRAVEAARAAFDNGPWPSMPGEERGALLKAVSEKITANKELLEQLEVQDSGGTIRKVREDVYLSARAMHFFSKLAAGGTSEPVEGLSKPGVSQNLIVREPVGVVAAIIPWNFPLKMAVWKLGPALAAGNTVVLKTSELTPVTALELAKMIHEAGIPPGVVNILPGLGEEVGEELAGNPMVDKVSFTGSTAVGKRVMTLAAKTLKNCTLECGGKSANIILQDADLDLAVDGALYAIFYHQGQCCEAGARLLLPDSLHEEFLGRMVARTRKMRLGDPMETSTDIGPLISEQQRARVLGYIASGVQEGARIAVGGTVPQAPELHKGHFVEPTIFDGVSNTMTIAREEIFGPVLSVIGYRGADDEAVRIANESLYGLGGGVWSRDRDRAIAVARKLRAGTVWVNEWHLISEKAPFGGYKQSGIGREFGAEGMRAYSETKHLHIDEIGLREKKFWYDTVVPKT